MGTWALRSRPHPIGTTSNDAKSIRSNDILSRFYHLLIGRHLGFDRIPFVRIALLCNMIGEANVMNASQLIFLTGVVAAVAVGDSAHRDHLDSQMKDERTWRMAQSGEDHSYRVLMVSY